MTVGKRTPVKSGGQSASGTVSNGPFVDHERVPPDAVDQASHGGGRRNAEKTGSGDLAQSRGGQGRPGVIDDAKRSHRK
jgi:hypothetical protein